MILYVNNNEVPYLKEALRFDADFALTEEERKSCLKLLERVKVCEVKQTKRVYKKRK